MSRSERADMAASIIRIVVGVHVAGRASVSCGSNIVHVVDPDLFTEVELFAQVAAITAVGFDGALNDAPESVTGTENSRIESIPALIVISVVERADVMVSTYDAPAVRELAILTIAIIGLVEPVIDTTLTLSLVA
jgi:hypothetical protein